eukprot:1537722-Rhodomonas_salina.1
MVARRRGSTETPAAGSVHKVSGRQKCVQEGLNLILWDGDRQADSQCSRQAGWSGERRRNPETSVDGHDKPAGDVGDS